MLRLVPILGALVLFLGFLLLNQDANIMFQSLADDTRRRYIGGEPLSDLIMLITLLAAVASLLIMLFWPRFEAPKHHLIVRHYFGHSHATPEATPAGHHLRVGLLRYFPTAMARVRRVRAYFRFAG